MTSRNRTSFLAVTLLSAACAISPAALRAQAPAGPLPPTQPVDSPPQPAPRPLPAKPAAKPVETIFGSWKLDRDDSDDPQKKMQQARSDSNSGYGGNRRMGGGYPGGGYPGGGYPGGGGYGGRRMGSQDDSDSDRQKMADLVNPSSTLTVAEATRNVEVDSFDDQQRKLAMFTDGRKLQKSKDANYQEVAAHWDGTRLVTDEKGPHGKMSRTYELSYDRTQLYETLHLTVGRSNTPVDIRYVYDQAPGASAAPAAAAASAPPQAKQ